MNKLHQTLYAVVLIYISLSVGSQASYVAELLLKVRYANHINIIHKNECMLYEAPVK